MMIKRYKASRAAARLQITRKREYGMRRHRVCPAAAVLFCLLTVSACDVTGDIDGAESIYVYYVAGDAETLLTSLIQAESYLILDGEDKLSEAVRLFSTEPENQKLRCALPNGVAVLSCVVENGHACLDLSAGFRELEEADRSVTALCAALTLCGLDEVNAVSITVEGEDTGYNGITPDDVLYMDEPDEVYDRWIHFYYADSDMRFLEAELQNLIVAREDFWRHAIDELLHGPAGGGRRSAIPEGTQVLSVELDGDLCVVDLTEEFYSGRPVTFAEARLAVYSIVNTLTESGNISRVRITVEGEQVNDYCGMDLSDMLYREEDIIGPADSAENELAVELYLLDRNGWPIIMPVIAQRDAYLSEEYAVIDALINARNINGTLNPIPEGSEIDAIDTASGICRVAFTHELVEEDMSGEEVALCVGLIVRTLTGLDSVSAVVISVDGEIPEVWESWTNVLLIRSQDW